MFDVTFLIFFLTARLVVVYPQDFFYPDSNLVIGNLRRREVIPLNSINNNYYHNFRRRYGSDPHPNLNYRRTKDIREELIDRRFELTEAQIREAKLAENKENDLDKLHSELRWLTIDTDEGIGIGI